MKILILVITLLLRQIYAHSYHCAFQQHNQDLKSFADKNIPQILQNDPGMYLHGRLLTVPSTDARRSMRMYVDSLALSSGGIIAGANGASNTTITNLNFLIQSLAVAKEFYQIRLKVGPLASITVPNYCVDFQPSNKGASLANVDLLIIVKYITNANIGYGATGKSCDYVTGALPDYTLQVGRPTAGRIILNTYNLVDRETSLTNRLFQSITSTVVHQMTHIIGFDSTLYNYFLNPATGALYTSSITISGSSILHASRPNTTLLKSPFVLAWARDYYNCVSLQGMPLQNQDGVGLGAGSHWQRVAIYDQLMTGTSLGATKGFSGLTFALLKDSGWYTVDETFAEKTNFGYKKGCTFVKNACYGGTSFPQFCNPGASSSSYCSTTFQGKATCSSTSALMSDGCGLYGSYFNCVDENSIDSGYQSYTHQVYQTNSYCVQSTLGTVPLPSNLLSRCYPYVCASSSIIFTIGSYIITCLSNQGGVLKSLSALAGTLKCPIFQQFCTVSRKTCSKWCNKNGYCTGGICNCLNGISGVDCSKTICSVSNFYNPSTDTCVSNCPTGTYQNIYSHTCQPCQYPCNECINFPTNCIMCLSTIVNPQYFYNSSCYSTCPSFTFRSGSQCIECNTTVNCATCSGSSISCSSCLNGLYLLQGSCVATCAGSSFPLLDTTILQCVASCPNNLIAVNQECVYCAANTFKKSGSCVSDCNIGCASPCTTYFYPDQTSKACLTCHISCLSCNGSYPQNCTSCKNTSGNPYLLLSMCWSICPKGYYANPTTGLCELCPVLLFCSSCIYNSTLSAPQCNSCKYNYFFQSSSSLCQSSCNSNQYKNTWNNSCNACEASCLTCNGPSSSNCLSCPNNIKYLINGTGGYCLSACPSVGYVPLGNNCEKCDITCNTCNGISDSQCSVCKSGYYLSGGYCRYICPNGTFPDSTTKTCLSCHNTCSYCFNSTANSCTFCINGLYLYNFTCSSNCPGGVTPNQYNICFQSYYQFTILLLMILVILK